MPATGSSIFSFGERHDPDIVEHDDIVNSDSECAVDGVRHFKDICNNNNVHLNCFSSNDAIAAGPSSMNNAGRIDVKNDRNSSPYAPVLVQQPARSQFQ